MEHIFSSEPMTLDDVMKATATMETMVMHIETIYGSWLRGGEFDKEFDREERFSELDQNVEGSTTERNQDSRSGTEPLSLDDRNSELKHASENSASKEISIPEGSDMELTDVESGDPEPEEDCGLEGFYFNSLCLYDRDFKLKQTLEDSASKEISIPEGSDMELTDVENGDSEPEQDCSRGSGGFHSKYSKNSSMTGHTSKDSGNDIEFNSSDSVSEPDQDNGIGPKHYDSKIGGPKAEHAFEESCLRIEPVPEKNSPETVSEESDTDTEYEENAFSYGSGSGTETETETEDELDPIPEPEPESSDAETCSCESDHFSEGTESEADRDPEQYGPDPADSESCSSMSENGSEVD